MPNDDVIVFDIPEQDTVISGMDVHGLFNEATKTLRELGDVIYFMTKHRSGDITTIPESVPSHTGLIDYLQKVIEAIEYDLA